MSKTLDFYFDFASPYGFLASRKVAALARGVCGSPFILIDGDPFWGGDQFADIERLYG
ncbi:hypothetical protein [Antarcticimicrobium sediminis]|uniref:hypothetical protein n=1 Tax=Antarcticimicrobium sediminis TaxID=2546227 RepID=UPI0014054953|nr:hypothetical protein [Antarcticimicrobium sediminis]